jgi:hypothetical protein
MDVHVRRFDSTVTVVDSGRLLSPELLDQIVTAVAEQLERGGGRAPNSALPDARLTSGPDFGDELEED